MRSSWRRTTLIFSQGCYISFFLVLKKPGFTTEILWPEMHCQSWYEVRQASLHHKRSLHSFHFLLKTAWEQRHLVNHYSEQCVSKSTAITRCSSKWGHPSGMTMGRVKSCHQVFHSFYNDPEECHRELQAVFSHDCHEQGSRWSVAQTL